MLDKDLAFLYKCTNGTKDINKAVKRNIERFPEDFYFQLTKEEYYKILRFQDGTLELKQGHYQHSDNESFCGNAKIYFNQFIRKTRCKSHVIKS
jgi:hypothetical protein